MKNIDERFLYKIYVNGRSEIRTFTLRGTINYNNKCYYIALDLDEGDLIAFQYNEKTQEFFGATKDIEIINEWHSQNGEYY